MLTYGNGITNKDDATSLNKKLMLTEKLLFRVL